jgi:acetyl esterase/lipase
MNKVRFGLVALVLFLITLPATAQQAQQVPAGVKAHRDLEYVPGGHERQKLDLYVPEKADGPLPVIVWIHGGAWRAGSKDRCVSLPMTTKGYAAASVGYRLSQHATFPAQIEDCKAAIRYLRANAKKYNLDPDRIGVWGGSAGGHLVALLGTSGDVKDVEGNLGSNDQSSRVQAVCDWFGPADFTRFEGGAAASPNNPLALLLGGPVNEKKDLAAKASPVTFASKDDPPFLIIHGDQDPTVPLKQSELLEAALKKAGVDVTLVVLKGAKHGGPEFSTPESMKQIQDFFDKHLKKAAK